MNGEPALTPPPSPFQRALRRVASAPLVHKLMNDKSASDVSSPPSPTLRKAQEPFDISKHIGEVTITGRPRTLTQDRTYSHAATRIVDVQVSPSSFEKFDFWEKAMWEKYTSCETCNQIDSMP